MRTLIWLIIIAYSGSPLFSQSFMAGAAVRNITPDPLLPVSGGVGQPNPVTEKKGDLYARAAVFNDGTTRIAIVSLDNLGWPAVLGDRSRELIPDIAPENILIGATHTHSAPDAYGFPDESGRSFLDTLYINWCVKQIAEAVNEALGKMEPADLKINTGEAGGKIAYNYYAPQLYDPRCGIIQAIGRNGPNRGKTIVTLVNYAVHPEVIGSDRGILSPDLCGPLCARIEEKAGGIALFMNGALGGMVTADNRRENGEEANDWEECTRIGHRLADEALRIINGSDIEADPGLYCASRQILFPVDSEMMRFIIRHSALGIEMEENMLPTRINLVNIGSAQIVTIPGEALPNIGYYVKRNMPTGHPFLFGLTNDAFGYLLTRVDFNSFRRYDYITRTCLGEMTGEIYINEVTDLINSSPPPKKQSTDR